MVGFSFYGRALQKAGCCSFLRFHIPRFLGGLVRAINTATRSRARNKSERIQTAYRPLFQFADELLERARDLEWQSGRTAGLDAVALRQQLQHFRQLTERVCG
jgi:hypothetical protein